MSDSRVEVDLDGELIEEGESPAYRWILFIFPAGLITLGVISLVFYLNKEQVDDGPRLRSATQVSEVAVVDLITKIERHAPQRSLLSEEGREGVRRTMSLTESSLGERNAGYLVEFTRGVSAGGDLWPVISVRIPPKDGSDGWLAVVASASAEDYGGVIGLISLGRELATRDHLRRGLLMILVPFGLDEIKAEMSRDAVQQLANADAVSDWVVLDELTAGRSLETFGMSVDLAAKFSQFASENQQLEARRAAWQSALGVDRCAIVVAAQSMTEPDQLTTVDLIKDIVAALKACVE